MRVVPSISPVLLEVNEGVLMAFVTGRLTDIQNGVEHLASPAALAAAEIKTGNSRNSRNSRNSEPLGNIKTKSSLGDEDNDNPATVTDRDELLRKIEIEMVISRMSR